MSYSIEQNFIPGLPQEAYDSGHYVGVIGHSTAEYNDSPDGERNFESHDWPNAFVHFFVGRGKIEQVADVNYVAYGAGHTANHLGYAQVELCQAYDSDQFAQDYAMYTWLLAKLLHDRMLGVFSAFVPLIQALFLASTAAAVDKTVLIEDNSVQK